MIVTVGCRADEVRAELEAERGRSPVQIVEVTDWRTGQSASVRAGVPLRRRAALRPP